MKLDEMRALCFTTAWISTRSWRQAWDF